MHSPAKRSSLLSDQILARMDQSTAGGYMSSHSWGLQLSILGSSPFLHPCMARHTYHSAASGSHWAEYMSADKQQSPSITPTMPVMHLGSIFC